MALEDRMDDMALTKEEKREQEQADRDADAGKESSDEEESGCL